VTASPSERLDAAAREKLETVLELLAVERASVSSVRGSGRAWRAHVDDSLTGLRVDGLREAALIGDIGAGAGFPGIPLAVALPDSRVDLIESVGRKCEFMRRGLEAAGIANARVLNARSEELAAGEGRGLYDAITARAVGRLSTLAELASPLLREGGVLVAGDAAGASSRGGWRGGQQAPSSPCAAQGGADAGGAAPATRHGEEAAARLRPAAAAN
jgi:16S rRNA (guanine527-N7)-methyltransferase